MNCLLQSDIHMAVWESLKLRICYDYKLMKEPSKWCMLSGEPEASMDVALCCGFSGNFQILF